MNPNEAAAALEHLARRVWRKQALRHAAWALAVVMPVTVGAGVVGGWSPGMQVLVGMVLMACGTVLSISRLRRRGIDAALVAAHLDRTAPTLEESTALLLQPPDALRLVERLQQRRVLDAFAQMSRPLPAPARGLRVAGLLAGSSLVISAALAVWMPRPLAGTNDAGAGVIPLHAAAADASAEQTPVRVEEARVTVTPPAYTGQAPAASPDLNVEALQDARAAWTIAFNQPVERAVLVFSDGDTLTLRADGPATVRAEQLLRFSGFYFLEAVTGRHRFRSDYYALSITEDLPPVFTVVQPAPRTVIAPGEPSRVALTVLANDDLGLDAARLVATVSRGSGENVKFREQALDFETVTKESSTRWTMTKTLDLEALAMEPGDELFFFVEGWDNKRPEPNRGRSETVFVALQDTSQWAVAPSLGLALNPAEEYLRSQRQIIIDTEKLIADKPNLDQDAFRQRSNTIGIDQKLLRLQYGQFLGEEFESTVTEAERLMPEGEAAEEDHEGHDDPDEGTAASSRGAAEAIIAQYAHMHDTEEGATFYSEDIKRELKAALAEMWEAELRLRTYRPEEALPYEYRALRLLKTLQQKARIYVKRIGFEPPPLKPDEARLTGNLDAVQSRSDRQDARPEASFPAIREALALLPTLNTPDEDGKAVVVLERAGGELAGVAVEEAGRYLAALQALRALVDELESAGTVCRACLVAVHRAFWNVLPPAEALPAPRREDATSLARRYFKQLDR